MQSIRDNFPDALPAFWQQRKNAGQRGIDWTMTFAEWWLIWSESGRWSQRGRGKGNYVMARHGDSGPYASGNVKIIEFSANNSEYIRRYWKAVDSGEREPPKGCAGRRRTHCKRGHEFTEENTYVYKGTRTCIRCRQMRDAKRSRLSTGETEITKGAA